LVTLKPGAGIADALGAAGGSLLRGDTRARVDRVGLSGSHDTIVW
jgi:hypothetical protein